MRALLRESRRSSGWPWTSWIGTSGCAASSGRNGFEYVARNYAWASILDKYERLFTRVLGAGPEAGTPELTKIGRYVKEYQRVGFSLHGLCQLHDQEPGDQDRLLRSRSEREDDQPPLHPLQARRRYRGEFICLETETERTFFFDLLPIKAGLIGEFKVHFQLMTVPGQAFYEASRKSVLKGADGIVFVADSQIPLLDANLENFDGLRRNCLEHNIDLNQIPLVFQYNKRDLNYLIPVETFNNLLNPRRLPFVEAAAINGVGVFESLREISKLTVPVVREKILGEKRKEMGKTEFHEESSERGRRAAGAGPGRGRIRQSRPGQPLPGDEDQDEVPEGDRDASSTRSPRNSGPRANNPASAFLIRPRALA